MKVIPSANPKSLNLNQGHPSKNVVLLVKSVQNWIYYNFSQRTARVTKLYSHLQYTLSHVIKFCEDVIDRGYDVISFISKYQNMIILRRARVAIFADIIKIVTTFIKKVFKDSKKVKRIKNCASKCNVYLYFLIYENLLISGEKCWCQQNSKGVSRVYTFFRSFSPPQSVSSSEKSHPE